MKKTYSGMRSRMFAFRKDHCDFFDKLENKGENAGAFVRQAVDAAISCRQDDEYRKALELKNTGVAVCPGCGRTVHIDQADGFIFSCPFCDRVLGISQTGARPDNAQIEE